MNEKEIAVKMILDSWGASVRKFNTVLDSLSDENLKQEVAEGRSRGSYLLGHLIAVHGKMLPLLGLGEALYPQWFDDFVLKSDKDLQTTPPAGDLRSAWSTVNSTLSQRFSEISADEWFERHTSVSEEDFAKEPHRNKLNVILSRVNHLEYHSGQFRFLKKEIEALQA